MLTWHDYTVDNAADIFELCRHSKARYWGFKEHPLPPEQMRQLYDRMHQCGKTTFLEVVAYTEDEGLAGARLARPDITLSAALMPEGAYDTAFAHLHYGQSYARLGNRFDMILPMAYSLAYGMDSAWVGKVTQGAVRCGARVLTGLHAYDGATGLTLKHDLDAALGVNEGGGICLFRYGTFVSAKVMPGRLAVVNPMDAPVTELEISGAAEMQRIKTFIPPGERREVPLSFAADTLRAWSDEKEICAYLR